MPTIYPSSFDGDTDAVVVGSDPLDADDDTYVEVHQTSPPERLQATWDAVPAAVTAAPLVRFSVSDDVEGVDDGDDYSEERFRILAYDAATSGDDLFIAWEGGAPVLSDGSSAGITTYDLDVWPLDSYTVTMNNGEWLTYENQTLGAAALDDWRPALLTQFQSGGLVMEVRRLNDTIAGRVERVVRVVELGVVYAVAPSASGGVQPRRIFQRSL